MKKITIPMHKYNFRTLDCITTVYCVDFNFVGYIMKSEKKCIKGEKHLDYKSVQTDSQSHVN